VQVASLSHNTELSGVREMIETYPLQEANRAYRRTASGDLPSESF
jgi:hypothetical protein